MQYRNTQVSREYNKVSVQGVVAHGCHFATLCREVDFIEAILLFVINFHRKGKYFYTFNHSYSEKSSNRATVPNNSYHF